MTITSKTDTDRDDALHARMEYATSSVLLPNGETLVFKVDLQEGGGFYVGYHFLARDGGIKAGETCFWCGDEKLGCMTCPKGQSPHGDCVKRTIKCVSDRAVSKWSPSSLVFRF